MSYAKLPRQEVHDLERCSPVHRRSPPLEWTLRLRLLVQAHKITALCLCVLGIFCLATFRRPGVSDSPWSKPRPLPYAPGNENDFQYRPRLPFVPEDGKPAPLREGAKAARWPEDYPEAASNLRANGVLRDVADPWPEKPWIASFWLAEDRFPEGLHGLPYDPSPLPDLEELKGKTLAPGLHDPPLPSFPANPRQYQRVPQVGRDKFLKPKDWSPPKSLPEPRQLPKVQAAQFNDHRPASLLSEKRRQWVKRAFLHAWEGYKANAFGHDEITPLTRKTRDSYNAWGATTIDALDLLLIMNLTHEYNVARTHVRSLDYSLFKKAYACNGERGPQVHLFETVIRYLGGLLSAYDLSHDELMLRRAKELGDWLLPAFNTWSGWPIPFYDLGSDPKGASPSRILAAEVGSLSMELTRLSQLTGDMIYANAALRVQDSLAELRGEYGSLVPHMVSPDGSLVGDFTIGGMVDSYYEYMVKMVQLLGDPNSVYGKMYNKAVNDMYRYLAVNVTITPDRSGMVLLGARGKNSPLRAVQEHLATFAGGMFGLGSKVLSRSKDLLMAMELTESAVWAYRSTATGLMPEIMEFFSPSAQDRYQYVSDTDTTRAKQKGVPLGTSSQPDFEYKGRPESIESVFYMYRITGDPQWQDHGWRMFTSWVKHSLTSVGFANIANVNIIDPVEHVDIQESFVLTETLKYYYLLFSPPDLISLDDYVFNTEAHPFRVPFPSQPHRNFWAGPESAVDAAYSDPRDRHYFTGDPGLAEQAPVGRGTAKQQMWRAETCK